MTSLDKASTELIQQFQNATRMLRQRAMILCGIMVIAFGFIANHESQMHYHSISNKKWLELYNLKDLDSASLKTMIERSMDDKDTIMLRYIDYAIDYKLKKSNYDNSVIFDEMQKIDRSKSEIFAEKSFNVLGIEIPLNLILLLSIIIVAIIFHEFTQILHYRVAVLEKIKEIKIEKWQLGPELFGYYRVDIETTSANYIGFISSILTAIVALAPITTGLMFYDYLGHIQGDSYIILINIACLSIIAIDTCIVFYKENLFEIQYVIDLFIAENNDELKIQNTIIMWFIMPLILISLHSFNFTNFNLSTKDQLLYVAISFVSILAFCLSLWICYKKPDNIIWKGVRFTFLTMNIFWGFIGIYTLSTGTAQKYLDIRFAKWINGSFIWILIIAVVYAILYSTFYVKSKTTKK